MSRHKFLNRLPSEELARRHRMNADADRLAKRDRRKDWIRGGRGRKRIHQVVHVWGL